jgi:hypothetical protein
MVSGMPYCCILVGVLLKKVCNVATEPTEVVCPLVGMGDVPVGINGCPLVLKTRRNGFAPKCPNPKLPFSFSDPK